MKRSAYITPDGLYRYTLTRCWGDTDRFATFIGLNPSTADGAADDPTVRRCVNFGKRWGMSGIVIVNLFALRATNPRALLGVHDPVGPENVTHIVGACVNAERVIACWGTQDGDLGHLIDQRVAELRLLRGDLYALGLTRSGAPRHPLYVPAQAEPAPWPQRAEAA